MLEYDFEESVSYWVGLTAHIFEGALNNELAGTGITLRQVQVLACLALYGNLPQKDLSTYLRIEPSTMVRILDRMERDGWINRCPAPQDRRKKIIQPTSKAAAKWEEIIACGGRMERQATAGLDQGQLAILKETLGIIRKNLGATM